MAIAFEDPDKPYESQSFFVASAATPADALRAIAPYGRARNLCGTGKRAPTPVEMYRRGYRVAWISSDFILVAIERTRDRENPLAITPEEGHDFRSDGHINIRNARRYGVILAREAAMLTEEETLGS